MIRLIHAFSALRGPQYAHSFIAKAALTLHAPLPAASGAVQLAVEKETTRHMALSATLYDGENAVARLFILLFLHAIPVPQTPCEMLRATPWRSFSAREIRAFAAAADDLNPIHQTDHPVVPGLLLLQQFAAENSGLQRLTLRFSRPVYADETIRLSDLPDGGRQAYGNSGEIFTLYIK